MSSAPRAAGAAGPPTLTAAEGRRVIIASSVGTVFEWYDFYLYATLAPFFAALFFPKGNDTAALLSAFATYAAGFLVRPFGAIFFGRIGDTVGRKYTFLMTIILMGCATALVGFLPTYETVGMLAPILLVTLRCLQGLALGGEYGGAATYVAEYAPDGKRGFATSWIQTTATVGFFLALIVIVSCRSAMAPKMFATWGWRIPFILSIFLLGVSIYIRMKLQESPLFTRMKRQGKASLSPLIDSFAKYPNNKYVALALFGATAGQGVVWYTGQFYALFFLSITLKVDWLTTYLLIGASLVIGTPFFILFGWLSDKIGRRNIILFGCLIAAATYFPLFKGLTHYANPKLEAYQAATKISVAASNCSFHIFVGPNTKFTPCDKAKDLLTKSGLSFESLPAVAGETVVTKIGNQELRGFDAGKFKEALKTTGYPGAPKREDMNYAMIIAILTIMMIYVTLVYGPIAAFLVELFPTNIRYTSMSLPYHIGNGWFGGMLPLLATAMVAAAGDIYYGLWYPIIVSLSTVVIGAIFLRETKDVKFHED